MKKHTHKELKQIGAFILDKSGSMTPLQDSAIAGFNEYLVKMQKNKTKLDFTLTLFDDVSIDRLYDMVSIDKVKPLSQEQYQPTGMTPLYDSVVDEIERIEKKASEYKDVAISIVIMTDGEENASRRHNEKCLRDLVKKLEARGNWTFAYMGANQDSYKVAAGIGIQRGNTMDWSADPRGTSKAFFAMAQASVHNVNNLQASFAAGAPMASLNNQNFFSGGGTK